MKQARGSLCVIWTLLLLLLQTLQGNTKTTYLWTVICPKKLTLAHNVFEGTELVALELIF